MPFGGKNRGFGLGELKVTQRLSPYEFGVELWILREGENRNRWDYRNLEECYRTFVGTPILCAYVGDKIGDGHNKRLKKGPDGQPYYSFTDATAERIVGTISEKPEDISLRKRDGKTWAVAKGRLFAFYAPELVEKIVRQKVMEISAETIVLEERKENGLEIFLRWEGIGVTILGDGVLPAVPGASVTRLNSLREEFREIKLRAAALAEESGAALEDTNHGNKKEGVRDRMKLLSKKQTAELAPRFAPFTVLAVTQGEKGYQVCLLSEDGTPHVYAMETLEDEFRPGKAQRWDVNARFVLAEGEEVELDVCEMFDAMQARLVKNQQDLAQAQSELSKTREALSAMKTAEETRRVRAAEKAVEDTLAAFNANRKDKIESAAVENIRAMASEGKFSSVMGEDGQWKGDSAAREAVLARCAELVMEEDRKQSEAGQKAFVWNREGSAPASDRGTIPDLLDKFEIGHD